jgi:hypothetical protein
MTWRYFGRTGGMGDIGDIYRISAEFFDGKLNFRSFDHMERLQPDGSWAKGQNDVVEKDWVHGWFGRADEISSEDVEQLVSKWRVEGWPTEG